MFLMHEVENGDVIVELSCAQSMSLYSFFVYPLGVQETLIVPLIEVPNESEAGTQAFCLYTSKAETGYAALHVLAEVYDENV